MMSIGVHSLKAGSLSCFNLSDDPFSSASSVVFILYVVYPFLLILVRFFHLDFLLTNCFSAKGICFVDYIFNLLFK